ncbi:MAG: ATP-binding protein [Candidatus Krumholzibacteriia bacterium]
MTDTPVVLIHGPRQSGKTTLARHVGREKGFAYYSFDDVGVRSAAQDDPAGFVAELPERVILDEIQRIPELFSTIKLAVDRDRRPGRFILTGSANILMIPRVSDSLAGRMEIVRLHPLSRCEILGRRSEFIADLFAGAGMMHQAARLGAEIAEIVAAGGYPDALARASERRRTGWYTEYVETIAQRDIKDLARIREIEVLPQIVALAAAQTAQLFNLAELAGPFRLSRPTIGDYVTLLEQVFLIHRLPSWHCNRLSRLIKAPKLHVGDTGVACAVLNHSAAALREDRTLLGHLLETYVVQELRRQASWSEERVQFHHFRTKEGAEVDAVLERAGRRIAGVEVKLSGTVVAKDFRGLKKLREAVGSRFAAGVVLYDGEVTIPFGEGLFAVPLSRLWTARA